MRKFERKRPLGRFKCMREDNIKIKISEACWKCFELDNITQDIGLKFCVL